MRPPPARSFAVAAVGLFVAGFLGGGCVGAFATTFRDVPVYDRYLLGPDGNFVGPAIVEERESTVIVGAGSRVTIDEFRTLRADLE